MKRPPPGHWSRRLCWCHPGPPARTCCCVINESHDKFGQTSLVWLLHTDRTIEWNMWQNSMHRSIMEQVFAVRNIVEQYRTEVVPSVLEQVLVRTSLGTHVGFVASNLTGWHHGYSACVGPCVHFGGRFPARASYESGRDQRIQLRVCILHTSSRSRWTRAAS